MFKIIGGDQREYGPVTTDELREWIAQGRASSQTLTQAEGTPEWKPLVSYPEFSEALAQQRASFQPPPSAPPGRIGVEEPWPGEALTLEYGRCFRRAGALLAQHPGPAIGGALLVWLVSTALVAVPVVGGILNLLLHGVLYGGLSLVYLRLLRNQAVHATDAFAGFSPLFAQLMLAGLISQVLKAVGLMLCALPGIYLMVAWAFALPLVADKGLDFWPALELSRRAATRCWFRLCGLMVLAYLPVVLFALFSLFRTFQAAWVLVQQSGPIKLEELTQILQLSAHLGIYYQLLFLLNLPFAFAVLLSAYEDLFPTRPETTA